MDKLIPSSSTMPLATSKRYQTTADNQKEFEIVILQGEELLAADNHKMGLFILADIPDGPKG